MNNSKQITKLVKTSLNENYADFDKNSDVCIKLCGDLKVKLDNIVEKVTELKGTDPSSEKINQLSDLFYKAMRDMDTITKIKDYLW